MSHNMSGEDISFLFIATSGVIVIVCMISVTCSLKFRRKCMNQEQQQQQQQSDPRSYRNRHSSLGDTNDWFLPNMSRNETPDERRELELITRASRAFERIASLGAGSDDSQGLSLDSSVEFRQLANVAAFVRQNNNNNNNNRVNPPAINQLWLALLLDSSFHFMDSMFSDGRQLQQQLSHKDQLTKEQQREFLCNVILKKNRTTILTPDDSSGTSKNHTSANTKETITSDEEAPITTTNRDPVHTITNSSENDFQGDGIIVCQLVSDENNDTKQRAFTRESVSSENNNHEDSDVPNTTSNIAVSTTSGNDDDLLTNTALNCPICLDDIDESDTVVNTPICHHVFHQDCLLQWLERNDLCPYCRQLVVTEEQWKEAYQTFTNQSNP